MKEKNKITFPIKMCDADFYIVGKDSVLICKIKFCFKREMKDIQSRGGAFRARELRYLLLLI